MTLTHEQEQVLDHLRAAYVGPEGGPDEVIVNGRPNLQYTVGILYPPEALIASEHDHAGDDDSNHELEADVADGELDDVASAVPLAEDWRPSSAAISFVTDGSSVLCDFAGGTYVPVDVDGPPSWRRTPFAFHDVELSADSTPAHAHSRSRRLRTRVPMAQVW